MKRLLTYLSVIIIMMMVPIGTQAWDDIQMIADFSGSEQTYGASGVNGNDATIIVDASSLTHGNSYNFKIKSSYNGGTYWGWNYTFDMTSNSKVTDIYASDNSGYFKIKHDSKYLKYKFTFNYTNQSNDGNWKWKITVEGISATLTIGGTDIAGTNSGSNYYFSIPDGSYTAGSTMTFTLKTETGGTATYYTGNFTGTASGDAFTYSTSSSSATMSYSVPSTATGPITVSLLTGSNEIVFAYSESGGGGTTTEKSYYLVGNFMSTDGSSSSDINYGNRIFLMKYIGNNQYTFDVPATLTVYSQILSVDGSTAQAYGPNSNQTTGPANDGTISGSLTSASVKTNNYWYMADRGISSDGMYTVTITVDGNGVPTNWSITHDQLTRVAYFLPNPSEHSNATAQPCYSKRNNSSSAGSNKYFGNFYLEQGKHAYVVSNITLDADNNNNSLLKTVNKLYLQGNGGGTPETGNDNDTKVYPHQSTGFRFNNTVAITLEYNPSKGTESNLQSSDNRIGGEILKGGSNQLDITSMAVIGNGVGTDWDLSNARAMTYNKELKCWEITITTTAAESTDNLFRFVANGSWDINWYENGTAATDKARVPYTGTGDGHAATEADVNVVEKTNDAHATTARDIIFNRPAGEWTIRFYTDATSTEGGNYFSYNFYYTITGTENTDPDATLSPGTDGGNYAFDDYTTGTAETLTVTLSNATKYAYAMGATSSVTLDESTTYTDASLTLTYDGTDVKDGSNNVVASSSNTVYVKIQGQDDSGNKGTTHTYQYTFNVPVVSTLDFTPKGGFFINKAVITVTDGTAPYTYTIKDASDNVLSTGTSSSATFTISTPGKLTVTDKDGNSATSSEKFDFTYSTSENYANYYNHGTTAQSVAQEGGKDATNIFLKKASYPNMRIYAWDDTYDQLIQKYQKGETTSIDSELSALGLTQSSESNWKDIWENNKFIRSEQGTGDGYTHTYNDTRAGFLERDPHVMLTEPYPGTLMSDSRSITIDGEEYYYLTLPLNRLHFPDNSQVGIIVTRNDDSYTDLGQNADKYKTADYKISSNSSFIYSSVQNGADYNNSIVDISDAVAGTNVVFYKNTNNWSNVNIYLYDSGREKTSWSDAPEMKKFDGNTYYYALSDNETWEHVVFSNNRSNSDKTNDLNYGGGRKMYEGTPAAGNTGTEQAGNAEYITYINKPSKYTVEVQNHPNGDDYLRAMPSDKTVLLDPTWGGVITPKQVADEETSVDNWNGVTGVVAGYRKFVKQDLTQTIYGLDNEKTYTVQAIVRVWSNQGAKVSLKVGDGEAVTSKNYGASSISHVNKNGRVDEKYTQGPDLDDPYFIHYDTEGKQGFGWQKIEATGKPTAAGNLVVTLTFDKGTSTQYNLSDVVLLEEANTAGHYWTKLPTDATSVADIKAGEIDMQDRSTYNAFSFFDRDSGNPNAMIKVSNRTVIGLNSGIAYVQDTSNANVLDDVDHRQSRNTISLNSDGTTWSGRYLYLYDESSDWSDCNAYGATVDFNMMGAKYDRQFTVNQHSTLFLPFAVTTQQLKTAGFKELQMVDVDNVTSTNIPLITWDLTKETLTDYTTTAGQGYIVIAGAAGASLSSFIKPTGGIEVQAANSALAKKTEATGLVGAYVYCKRNQTEDAGGTTYMNYSYLNDKFRALATAAQGGAEIKPFRATFAVPNSVVNGARMLSTFIIDADEVFTPTGVDKLGVEEQLSGNIYTLDGRLVSTNGKLSELSRGIYVRGGRKIVVK